VQAVSTDHTLSKDVVREEQNKDKFVVDCRSRRQRDEQNISMTKKESYSKVEEIKNLS
jgi:hypothetical protein